MGNTELIEDGERKKELEEATFGSSLIRKWSRQSKAGSVS